jgi:hypothetical protein
MFGLPHPKYSPVSLSVFRPGVAGYGRMALFLLPFPCPELFNIGKMIRFTFVALQ